MHKLRSVSYTHLTEVVAQLLEYYYRGNIMEAVTKVLHRIEGAYALGIICADCPDRFRYYGRSLSLIHISLVSLTTMTRMVEDDRTQIGTMKALGYSKNSIAAKYILYALSATLLGSLLGVVAGSQILPRVIMSAYGILYVNLKEYVVPIQTNYALMSTALAVLCTVAATVAACYRELTSTPAQLMRPVAPKEGRLSLIHIFF